MKTIFKILALYCLTVAILFSAVSCKLDMFENETAETEQGTTEVASTQTTPEETTTADAITEETIPEEITTEDSTPEASTTGHPTLTDTTPDAVVTEESSPEDNTTTENITTTEDVTSTEGSTTLEDTTTFEEITSIGETTTVEETTSFEEITTLEETSTLQETTTTEPPHEHIFVNGECECGFVLVIQKESVYDNDNNGEKDVFCFSPRLPEKFEVDGVISLSAEKYDKKDYFGVRYGSVGGRHKYWYCQESRNSYMIYQIEVEAAGTYELAIYMYLEATERAYGAKYTINGEYSFETSYQFATDEELGMAREGNETMSSYMFGIQIELKAGTNIIKIEGAANTEYNQLFRYFYFAKIEN